MSTKTGIRFGICFMQFKLIDDFPSVFNDIRKIAIDDLGAEEQDSRITDVIIDHALIWDAVVKLTELDILIFTDDGLGVSDDIKYKEAEHFQI